MKTTASLSLLSLLPDWVQAPIPRLGMSVGKEVREVAGMWLFAMFSAVAVVAGALGNAEGIVLLGTLMSALLMIIMGAAVFGHEFAYRTVSLLLVQPVPRAVLWRRKMAVLAVAVGTVLTLLMIGAALVSFDRGRELLVPLAIIGLGGAVGGLLVAPWYTLACRSTLAGAVFTLAMPAAAFLIGFLASLARFGSESEWQPEAVEFRMLVSVLLIAAQCLAGPFLAFRWFRRLEGIDTSGQALHLPRWSVWRQSPARPARAGSGWWRRTVAKELRLQTPSLIVAGILVLASGTVLGARLAWPEARGTIEWLEMVTAFYMFSVALLVGALACAEDRQTGTMLWHLVLPASAAQQWVAKTGVAIVLSLALAVGIPWLVSAVQAAAGVPPIFERYGSGFYAAMAVQTLCVCCVGLYMSSMAPSGLRAVLWALPVAILIAAITLTLAENASAHPDWLNLIEPARDRTSGVWAEPANLAAFARIGLVLAGVLLAVLACGYGHYRRLDASVGRVLWHMAALAACILAGGIILTVGLATLHALAS